MKKILFTFVLLCSFLKMNAQSLYDVNTIQDIKIEFSQNNWDYILDTAIAGKESYIMAKYVIINGVVYDSVGVRYKGNSTYKANQAKNPLHIELDTWKDQDYEGFTDIKLSNIAFDPSFIREPLSYTILRQYMDAPQCNFANVTINGTLMGLYVSAESISKKFVKKYFGNNDNAFFKCNPKGGGVPGGMDKPNLAYLGADSSKYLKSYELKTDYGWNDMVQLCNILNNNPGQIETILDVDRALWMLAFNNVLVNLDSYSGAFTQNYYLYKDNFGRFNPIVWDLNMSFGVFSFVGGATQLFSTTSKQQLSHLLHSNEGGWPLIQKLLANPQYRRMYIAHMRTMINENFANGSYKTPAQAFQTLIGPSVQNDPNKFYSYQQFQNSLTTDIPVNMFQAPGIFTLMDGRATHLLNQADFKAAYPVISDIQHNNDVSTGEIVYLTANVSGANADAVTLAYRHGTAGPFTKVKMYDDGQHNDGAAGDNVYGADFVLNSSIVQYYIYAENSAAGAFSPERAEHEFYTIYSKIDVIEKGEVVINELMSNNETTVTDPSGKYSDWIELYNNTDKTISLKDAYLSDSYSSPLKWKFPDNASIGPKSYLIIWASDTSQAGLNASFKLSNNGEQLILSYENGFVTDSVSFPSLKKDKSYARCPNGTGNFDKLNPSFAAINCESSSADDEIFFKITVFPNPAKNRLFIDVPKEITENPKINIYDVTGRKLRSATGKALTDGIDITNFAQGQYIVEVLDNEDHIILVKSFLKI